MPTYGNPDGGTQATYNGSSTHDPDLKELMLALLKVLGVNGVDREYDREYPIAPLAVRHWLNPTGSPRKDWNILKTALEMLPWTAPGGALMQYVEDANANLFEIARQVTALNNPSEDRYDEAHRGWVRDWTGDTQTQVHEWGVSGVSLSDEQVGDLVYEVWHYAIVATGVSGYYNAAYAVKALEDAAQYGLAMLGYAGIPLPHSAGFVVIRSFPDGITDLMGTWLEPSQLTPPAPFDWSALEQGDTLVGFLTRTQPAFAWNNHGPWHPSTDTGWAWAQDAFFDDAFYRCIYTQHDIDVYLAQQAVLVAPVWPGFDQVEYGTPVEDAETGMYTMACDGVLVDITFVPAGVGKREVGSLTSWSHAGWIAFVSDNDDAEPLQWLAIDRAVYVPRSMAHAAAIALYTRPGLRCTVTPWVRAL